MDWITVVMLLIALAAVVQLWMELARQKKQTLSANFAVEEAQRELDRLQAAQAQPMNHSRQQEDGQEREDERGQQAARDEQMQGLRDQCGHAR